MLRVCLLVCCCSACTPDPVPTNRFHESTKALNDSIASLGKTITETTGAYQPVVIKEKAKCN